MPFPRLVAAAALSSIFGMGCSAGVYMQGEQCELQGDRNVCMDVSCTPIGGSSLRNPDDMSTLSMAGSSDFLLEQSIDYGSLVVVVKSGEEELARHKYGEKQAESGKRYSFAVTTHAGHTYELAYWGVRRCDLGNPEDDS